MAEKVRCTFDRLFAVTAKWVIAACKLAILWSLKMPAQ